MEREPENTEDEGRAADAARAASDIGAAEVLGGADDDDFEVVDGLPVPADDAPAPAVQARGGVAVPAVQAAAIAATGFVAGAATVAVVARRRARPRRRKRKKGVVGEIVGTNSFLVDVHLVRRS